MNGNENPVQSAPAISKASCAYLFILVLRLSSRVR